MQAETCPTTSERLLASDVSQLRSLMARILRNHVGFAGN